ncbi:PEP-CTERM sorting domain-containing protein [Bythopirellula goksoeyrii]|uniref:Ice-binding protein C-terminal domain-containing protein n=1 Tax=Bythopirellula goksoeyrii TaxID=1400387 RepID=A0A5B9QJN5_9BACT|nr:PEP-CTERM sorting domain-containing protein [Bythopirellula goksoeyrii]QEG37256.1 hypothetical protein Pr1d_45970 [Bythopirellula goksoeyrii]
MLKRLLALCGMLWGLLCGSAGSLAQHQTAVFSPVFVNSALPYRLELQETTFGTAAMPTLHSFSAAIHDGKWFLIAGRTNGLHDFTNSPSTNFPEQYQNRDIWVIDPLTQQSWSRSLEDVSSGLDANEIASLTPTNQQFTHIGDRLYITGGYGVPGSGNGFTTFDTLSAIDLDGMIDWVVTGTGQAADHIRQLSDPIFKITGGAMYEIDGRTHLVFGQDFTGGYIPGKTGAYSEQVRSFDIVDNGTTLSVTNATTTPQVAAYHRRDLNVYPVVKPGIGGSVEEGLTVLSGVFTPDTGVWTVPVEIDQSGLPTMADPLAVGTFKQAMNQYHSAKVGLYSAAQGAMHELLLGGITLKTYDEGSGTFVQDDDMPFTSQATSVVVDSSGNYSQHLIGAYPELFDTESNLLRFGANGEFFLAPGIATYDNGVIDLDLLHGETVVGYVFGGIVSNAPHVRDVEGAMSSASNRIFEVVISLLDGDYDRNGMVDGLDLALWQSSYGTSVAPGSYADGNANGLIDGEDFLIWQRNVAATFASNLAVPEPATWLLLVGCALICSCRRRRQAKV